MPHPDILRVLNMSPADWGKLPFHDDTRQRLRERAIAILKGDEVPVDASNQNIIVQEAINAAEREGTVSRAGFEQAMIQQAKQFGEAVEQLRQRCEELKDQIKVMEDSRADFTYIVLERLKAVEAKINIDTGGEITAT